MIFVMCLQLSKMYSLLLKMTLLTPELSYILLLLSLRMRCVVLCFDSSRQGIWLYTRETSLVKQRIDILATPITPTVNVSLSEGVSAFTFHDWLCFLSLEKAYTWQHEILLASAQSQFPFQSSRDMCGKPTQVTDGLVFRTKSPPFSRSVPLLCSLHLLSVKI